MCDNNLVEPAWLTVNQTTRYLGISRSGVYLAAKKQQIEIRRAFGRSLVSRASLDAYLAAAPRLGVSTLNLEVNQKKLIAVSGDPTVEINIG